MSALDDLIARDMSSGNSSTPASLDSIIASDQGITTPASVAPSAGTSPQPYQEPFWEGVRNGLATAPINAYLGAKQFFGGLSPEEQRVLQYNKEAEQAHPALSLASNALTAAPTFFIPGMNTLTGAALVGGAQGLLQPVDGDQSLANIAKGKAINTAVGTGLGAAGQWAGNKVGNFFTDRLAAAREAAATAASQNAPRDAALQAARDSGYQIPNSISAPSFWSNRLESLGGKAAIKQNASINNQQVTNSLARQAVGIAEDTPITQDALANIRSQAWKNGYEPITQLPARPATAGSSVMNVPADPGFDPKATLGTLVQARSDAKLYFNAYNRTGRPEDLAAAKAAQALADNSDNALANHAASQGRSDLMPALYEARKRIAQTYTVERALNQATGDVSAPVLGRLAQKGSPLSGGLDTIGNTAATFPQVMRPAATTPAPGVGKTEALAASLLALGGHAAGGIPGMVAGAALPLASHAARGLALALKNTPSYGPGLATRAAGNLLSPQELGLALRTLTPYALPAQ